MPGLAILLALAELAYAQFDYVPAYGPMPKPAHCTPRLHHTSPKPALTPAHHVKQFAFTQTETVRTATPIAVPLTTATYGPKYEDVSFLAPNVRTTSWTTWNPNVTATATDSADPYGTAAWSTLWSNANPLNFTATGYYTATVEPTPVPSSELVYPPPSEYISPDCYDFPSDFFLGVAGSASQIEGAVAHEGKGPTNMDLYLTSHPGVADNYIANENYYYYKQDILRLAALGFTHYSFSISWSRIQPFAVQGSPLNSQGLAHYDDLINFAISQGMTPVATLTHFDTPLPFYPNLSALSIKPDIGYINAAYQNETFEDSFVSYGKIILTHFADRVSHWVTFNEPFLASTNGKSIDTVIKAHARLSHFYHDTLNATGKIALKLNHAFGLPEDPSNLSHVNAATWFNDLYSATFLNPLVLGTDYPDSFKAAVPDYVPLTPEDLAYTKGTLDFIGLDFYVGSVVKPLSYPQSDCLSNASDANHPACVNLTSITAQGWNIGYRSQTYVYTTPRFLRAGLHWLASTFSLPIIITEFGFPVFGETQTAELQDRLYDSPRAAYYTASLTAVLRAIWEDGVQVAGVLAWSFADNWEFGDYTAAFGIQSVNRSVSEGPGVRARRYKRSAFDLVDFVASRRAGTMGK